jgi:hypothetical protein
MGRSVQGGAQTDICRNRLDHPGVFPILRRPIRSSRMANRSVLAIAVDPAFADFTTLSGLTPELVRSYIDAQIEQVWALGYDVESCLIDLGDTAEAMAPAALSSKSFDCIMIGPCGSRNRNCWCSKRSSTSCTHSPPNAKICLNSNTADTAEAVQRWLEP